MGFKVRLNSVEKTEALIQEIYDDAVRQINMINIHMNELRESTQLIDTPIDLKTKYAKAMHDYATDIHKAKQLKLDVSKLLVEVLKFNGNVEKAMEESEIVSNLSDDFKKIREQVLKKVDKKDEITSYEVNTSKTRE